MTKPISTSRFGHIYGYGLLVLWATTCLLTVVSTLSSGSAQLGQTFTFMSYTIGIFTFIALPIAAILTLIIAGTIWLALLNTMLTNRQKAIFAGGVTGALPALLILSLIHI